MAITKEEVKSAVNDSLQTLPNFQKYLQREDLFELFDSFELVTFISEVEDLILPGENVSLLELGIFEENLPLKTRENFEEFLYKKLN